MTPEEAIKTIQVAVAEVEWNYPMNYAQAFETAIEALEKQIPKRIKKKDIGSEIEEVYCPCCGKYYGDKIKHNSYLFWTPQHCECGQALDWRDTE